MYVCVHKYKVFLSVSTAHVYNKDSQGKTIVEILHELLIYAPIYNYVKEKVHSTTVLYLHCTPFTSMQPFISILIALWNSQRKAPG